MSEAPNKDAKRKPRRHPRGSAIHLTVWTMNGAPMPDSVQRKLEQALEGISAESGARLLNNVRRV